MQSQGSERKFRLLACAVADAVACFLGGWTFDQRKKLARFEEYAEGHGSLPITPADYHLDLLRALPAERLPLALVLMTKTVAFDVALTVCTELLGPYHGRVFYERHKQITDEMRVFEPILYADRHLVHDAFDHRMRLAPLLLGDAPDVQNLARAIYADKSFADMPVLGDALEDAGCDDEEALDHCRNHPLHARGCWVLDAILCRG